ncbi:MAG: hypothetical protein U0232_23830 [Thermomicrobiales bacterium]
MRRRDAHPERVALVYEARRWTYGALRAERDRRAGVLVELGMRPATSRPRTISSRTRW